MAPVFRGEGVKRGMSRSVTRPVEDLVFFGIEGPRAECLGVDSKTFDSLKWDLSGSECEESGFRAARDLVPLNCGKPVD